MEKNFFSLSAALLSDPFCSKEITDISIINEYFVRIDFNFHTALRFATIEFNKIFVSLFISFQCCYHSDIATFSFLRAGGN